MAVQEEIFKLRYQAEGQAAISRARDELDKLQAAASRAAEKFKDGTFSSQRFATAAERLGEKIAHARNQLNGLERASAGGAGGRNIGLAAIEASRALEDLNFGLVGVINNIPQLVMHLGGPAGLTAAIGVLGAAALYLSRNWDTVLDTLGVGIPQPALAGIEGMKKQLESVNEQLDKMREKTRLTAAEFVKIGQLETERQTLQAEVDRDATIGGIFAGKSEKQQQISGGFATGIREAGLTGDAGRARFGDLLTGAIGRAGGNRLGVTGTTTEQARGLAEMAAEGSQQARDEVLRLLEEFGGAAGVAVADQIKIASEDLQSTDDSKLFGPSPEEAALLQAEARQRDEAEKQREAIRDEEAALVDANDAENLAEFRRRRQENEQKTKAVASSLLGGNTALADSLAAGTATEDDVRQAMIDAGFSEETADRRAGGVLEAATEQTDADVRERALAMGISEDDARMLMRAEKSGGAGLGTPGVFDAGSFAQSVQAGGAKDPAEIMKEQLGLTQESNKIAKEIRDEIRRRGRFGA